jgi:hypothetical protein
MLTSSDFIHLAYSPRLSEDGIAFACRWLACNNNRIGDSPFSHLRRITSGAAVELAFRHYLSEQAVPFQVLGATPFTHPEQYDVSLGGHRCVVKSFLITHRSQIAQVRREPGILLDAPALLPMDEFASEEHKPDDLYLFVFLLGVAAATLADVNKAIAADQPISLIHVLPDTWARPVNWIRLEKLALKSECETPVTVEIGGQDDGRDFINATLTLPPRQRILVEEDFHSLAYIQTHCLPEARIGIHSPQRGEAYLIPAHGWGNLWIYGMDILFTGWLTHEDFRRKASVLNAGMHTFQFDRTRIKNLLVPVGELEPIQPLLEKVKAWELEKRNSINGTVE